jgi:hypothetical protein
VRGLLRRIVREPTGGIVRRPRRAITGVALGAAAAVAILSGCASATPRIADLVADGRPPRIELASVPFFPQVEYQCGPAALATVLSTADRTVTPSELVAQVYLPGRRGSLQPEIVAATRTHDQLPYLLAPSLDAAVAQLAGSRPVLVMQNLGWKIRPAWHFAVLIGYDATANTVVLRSGETERLVMKARRFDRTWARAERWALVALPPGELPAQPDLDRYMAGAAGLEAVGRLDAARAAYARARERWPESAWPWLGLANLSHAAGELDGAEDAYREALARDPDNIAARHNLAETLERRGCLAQARAEIDKARAVARGTPLEERVEASAQRIVVQRAQTGEQASCSPTPDS